MIYQGQAQYPVTEVILHTAATPGDWWHDKTLQEAYDEIDRWHKDRGWKGFGYHLLVYPDGSSMKGRNLNQIGAHVREHNRGTIGICMVPVATHEGIKTFDYYFTTQQRKTVMKAIEELHAEGVKRVTGHNDYAPKECPGFIVKSEEWLPKEKKPNYFQRMWRRWT